MKKILFISCAKNIGGGEIFLKNLLCEIIILKSNYKIYLMCNKKLQNVISLEKRLINPIKYNFINILQLLFDPPDIVIYNEFRSALFIPLYFRSKCFVILHTTKELGKKWYNDLKLFIYRYLSFFISQFVSVSQTVKKSWKPITDSIVIENGIQIPLSQYFMHEGKVPRIGYVGNFSKSKGQEEFINILIENNLKNEVHFYGEGDLKLKLEKSAKENKLNAFFHGQVFEPEKIYKSFDIFAFCSTSEGCPLAPREALSYGKLVISYDIGDIKNIIIDGYNGYIVPFGDKSRFGEILCYLLKNTHIIKQMQKNIVGTIPMIRTTEKMAVDYLQLFE